MAPLVEIPWKRGHYLARLGGPDSKWGVVRDFVQGRPVKTRHVVAFGPGDMGPGFYEIQDGTEVCPTCGGRTPKRRWVAYDGQQVRALSSEAVCGILAEISAGPNPGEPGCWGGDRCRCGADVERYDEDGWPWCAAHYEEEEVA